MSYHYTEAYTGKPKPENIHIRWEGNEYVYPAGRVMQVLCGQRARVHDFVLPLMEEISHDHICPKCAAQYAREKATERK